MNINPVEIIEEYYTSLAKKNVQSIEKYLHPDVRFIGPLDVVKGKKSVLEATQNFAAFFKTLTIRAKFGSKDQAIIVYDVDFPEPMGKIRSTSLMTFKDGLVTEIELFYDGRPVEKMKSQIFS